MQGVITACNVSPGDGWWKAHNFIEMGVELFIFEKRPELLALLHKALTDTVLIGEICSKIALSLVREPMLPVFRSIYVY
ncbi:MAG: hypothetical protein AB1796_11020 [Bacillota bacterium]